MKAAFVLASLALLAVSNAQDDAGSFVRARDLSTLPCFSCMDQSINFCYQCSGQWVGVKYQNGYFQGGCDAFTSSNDPHCVTCDGMDQTECEDELLKYVEEEDERRQNPDRSGVPGACEPDEGGTAECSFGEADEVNSNGRCIGNTVSPRHGNDGCCVKKAASCVCAYNPDDVDMKAPERVKTLERIVKEYGNEVSKYCHKEPEELPIF